ncbi:MAG: NADH-quinone oxidoreductase subunit C [Nitrospiraceae bacterium]|nr:NADH-quinone oxidoreductase subunit C [Nitrospiraceae bacterium]
MDKILAKAKRTKEYLNEYYIEIKKNDFKEVCSYLSHDKNAILRMMFGTDEREIDGTFKIYSVFTIYGNERFFIIYFSLTEEDNAFPSITHDIPAAHWYEREIKDMLGLIPDGHPDTRSLVFHDAFPKDSYPLRKDWNISDADLEEWGKGIAKKRPYNFMEVKGEGIYEIPVGPVHAGIIEPGHFRFSAVGETIFFLESRLFYTHKGTEKHFEKLGFTEGVKLAERISGTSSYSYSCAYCMAVERMTGAEITEKAKAVRTLLIELERLYNHIGDIGNMCAGTGLQVGYAKGAAIKESLMQLNERLTGSRYLRGVNIIGGVNKDILLCKDDIFSTLSMAIKKYKELMKLLLGTVSHVERLENTGRLSKEIAQKLGVTGVAARASGIEDDLRKTHPHLLYERLAFEEHVMSKGDVLARMMIRAEEAECSISIISSLLENKYKGDPAVQPNNIPGYSSALGFAETPHGSLFFWIKADKNGRPLRVKFRSPSFCNWPAVPFAVHGNIVPDFPLCNKSFNLSYSGCDM